MAEIDECEVNEDEMYENWEVLKKIVKVLPERDKEVGKALLEYFKILKDQWYDRYEHPEVIEGPIYFIETLNEHPLFVLSDWFENWAINNIGEEK